LRPRRVTLLTALAGASLLAAAISACSSDGPSGYAQSSSSGAVPEGGTPTGDAEAGLPQPQEALCKGLVIGARVIDELGEPSKVPTPYGGAIKLGTYDLDELYAYGGAPDAGADGGEEGGEFLTGRSGTGTLVVTTKTLAFIEAYGPKGTLPAPVATGYAYSAEGTTISAARVCPETIATKAIPYSCVGDSLALFVDPTHRLVFRRRPE
jgi:hypothetical protein